MSEPAAPSLEQAIADYRDGRFADAERACQALIADGSAPVEALNLLGMIAARDGRLEAGAAHFRAALARAPHDARLLANLAEALRRLGRPDEAVPLLQDTVARAPGHADAHGKLALVLSELGRFDEALAACEAGLAQFPGEHRLCGLAAEMLMQLHRWDEALAPLTAALEQAPTFDTHWIRLARLLRARSLPLDEGRRLLPAALMHPAIRPSTIAASAAATLLTDPMFADLARRAREGSLPRGSGLIDVLECLSRDELFLTLLRVTTITDAEIERLLTALRRALLDDAAIHEFPASVLSFCAALSTQAFLTEYAWCMTGDESARVDDLAGTLVPTARPSGAPPVPLALRLTIVAAYRPLYTLAHAADLARAAWPEPLRALIRAQIDEPLEERALRATLPRLTPITAATSVKVRAQYEENPYPRWIRAERTSPTRLTDLMRGLGASIPGDPSFATPDVLIAGCGTGQHAIAAAPFYQDARLLAVDLSLSSLAYAVRKTREAGLNNIAYAQGDLNELGALNRRFHVIECSGVLVCVEDPLASWRMLVELLHPGGLMNIGLYSEAARRVVVEARRFIADRGYPATAEGIRRCRRDLLDLPDDHPLAPLRMAEDFYSLSNCRDMLFHVLEHRFTLPWIRRALVALGLRFLRFSLAETAGYRRRYPEDPRMISLMHWEAYEREHPDTFVGMYQFWVQKTP